MRRVVLVLALGLSSIPHAAMAAKPTDAQIDQLLEVTRSRQLLDSMLVKIDQMQKQAADQMLAGEEVSDKQRADVDRLVAISSRNVHEVLTWDKLAPMYHRIYADTFDGSDIDAMIAFYKTEAGQHVLDRMPMLMQELLSETQAAITPMMEKMHADLAREIEAIRKEDQAAKPKSTRPRP